MYQSFSMMDVNNNYIIAKKKGVEERMQPVDKLKIIMALEDVYNL